MPVLEVVLWKDQSGLGSILLVVLYDGKHMDFYDGLSLLQKEASLISYTSVDTRIDIYNVI